MRTTIKYFSLLDTEYNILYSSREQPGPMLFSTVAQAEAELRMRPRASAKVIPIILSFVI